MENEFNFRLTQREASTLIGALQNQTAELVDKLDRQFSEQTRPKEEKCDEKCDEVLLEEKDN